VRERNDTIINHLRPSHHDLNHNSASFFHTGVSGRAGVTAGGSSLGSAILLICISAWLICSALRRLDPHRPPDIHTLREQMQDRAGRERALADEEISAKR
jgi:hypothetical protein